MKFLIMFIDELISKGHRYRKFIEIIDFDVINLRLRSLKSDNPNEGYGLFRIFKCLFLQFLEDLSDRELETFLQENIAGKWFCGFDICDKTPDHTVFTRARKKLGTKLMSEIFSDFRDQLKKKGYMNEVFTFIDATHLISKARLWEERDNAIKEKYDKLNNENVDKFANDKQAKFGSKGKNKFWFVYKKHVSVDMRSGLINKVAITPANVTDSQGLGFVCPKTGAIFADKGYCQSPATTAAKRKFLHLNAIKKNNMKDKIREKDKWISKMRAPYERVFSKENKRVRYIGICKNQFMAFMQAFAFNVKRVSVLRR